MSDHINFQQVNNHLDSDEQISGFHQTQVLNRSGGVLEVRVGGAESNNAPLVSSFQGPQITANLGAVTTISAGGTTRITSAVQTASASDITGGHEGFLATARNNGIPAMGRLTPGSVVQYQGIEVSLAQLEAIGVVQRTNSGGYEAVAPAANNQPQQTNQNDTLPEGVELFSNDVEADVGHAIVDVPQHLYDQAVAVALEHGLDSVGWAEIAYQSGISHDEARSRAAMIEGAFAAQADRIITAHGIPDPNEFYLWAEEEQSAKFSAARRQLAFGRNTTAMRSLVKEYMDTVPPTVEALKRGGFAVRQDSNGNTVINYKGIWMTSEAATRAGLV
jgi:hypothetical protein